MALDSNLNYFNSHKVGHIIRIFSLLVLSSISALPTIESVQTINSLTAQEVQLFKSSQGRDELAADALRMLAISHEYQSMGSVLLEKLPKFQEKLIRLYTESLGNKETCRWTQSERQGWLRTFKKMNVEFERHLNTTLFGFFRTFEGSIITRGAMTRPATANIEMVAMAIHHAGVSDLVIEKFSGYLREKMVRRQQRFHSCTWTGRDKREADEGIHEIYREFLQDMSVQVSKMSQFLQTNEIKLKDISDGQWGQKMYGTLFQGFDQADAEFNG